MSKKKMLYAIYLVGYLLSALFYLAGAYVNGGTRSFFIAFALFILISIFVGPLLFYRVFFRHAVWIPGGVDYGPASEDWEWIIYSILVGFGSIFIFIFIFVATI